MAIADDKITLKCLTEFQLSRTSDFIYNLF